MTDIDMVLPVVFEYFNQYPTLCYALANSDLNCASVSRVIPPDRYQNSMIINFENFEVAMNSPIIGYHYMHISYCRELSD